MEALRDNFKEAYARVRRHLMRAAKWQKIGYDTGLKVRVFKIGDLVLRLHQPLEAQKLVSSWDGPQVVYYVSAEYVD